ncbi:hypothetical protein HanIR_Chr13g0634181 [Helianthus annuus]|nr:hypothetical protein HanIR_Chr13g0634181 [Helianthus annuus]
MITTTSTPSSPPTCCSSSVDFQLNGIKHTCYTSLRDILPSPPTAIHSPKPPYSAPNSGYDISIRNRLVKQAAWAYLQPMSTSHESDESARVWWTQFSGSLIRLVTAAFDCLLLSIHP